MADDIVSEVNSDEKLVDELKVEQHKGTVEKSIEKNPLAKVEGGLNEALVEMTKRGVNSALFQGVERCIRVVDKGSAAQRHCMSMMVTDTVNGKVCTRCFKQSNPGVVRPKVINSSMIKLNDKELKECGLDKDPTYIPPEQRSTALSPELPRMLEKAEVAKIRRHYTRRPKVAVPNSVKIEVSMDDLEESKDIPTLLMQRALEGVFNLPIAKYSDAEKIRITSDRIKEYLIDK